MCVCVCVCVSVILVQYNYASEDASSIMAQMVVYMYIYENPLYALYYIIIVLIVVVIHVTSTPPAIPFTKHVCSAVVRHCVHVSGPNSQAN